MVNNSMHKSTLIVYSVFNVVENYQHRLALVPMPFSIHFFRFQLILLNSESLYCFHIFIFAQIHAGLYPLPLIHSAKSSGLSAKTDGPLNWTFRLHDCHYVSLLPFYPFCYSIRFFLKIIQLLTSKKSACSDESLKSMTNKPVCFSGYFEKSNFLHTIKFFLKHFCARSTQTLH